MNREFILFNLREARDELDRTINELQSDPEYDYGNFVVAVSHIYQHINTAWNARDASNSEAQECSQANFDKWRQFPDAAEVWLV